ncbi:hypothetical protein [Methyloglobulus sp.]|uniref:hypothetical protein n=1 Tax=Methyloglobulus sp. TaxID=2518622 RepID=UPI0032B707D9
MNFKKTIALAVLTLPLSMIIMNDAYAVSVDVKCETRGISRSKASVDGRGFGAGLYRALARSGTGAVWSKAFKRPVAGEVEFDFDSNPADVAAGATAIAKTFIKNNSVNGRIYSYNATTKAYTLRASITESCRAR